MSSKSEASIKEQNGFIQQEERKMSIQNIVSLRKKSKLFMSILNEKLGRKISGTLADDFLG